MMIKARSFAGIAVAGMLAALLTVMYATPGFAWYYYANTDGRVTEEISTEREPLPVGTIVSTLPSGARSVIIERTQYFISGKNWFLPIIDKEGIRYQVVFAPV